MVRRKNRNQKRFDPPALFPATPRSERLGDKRHQAPPMKRVCIYRAHWLEAMTSVPLVLSYKSRAIAGQESWYAGLTEATSNSKITAAAWRIGMRLNQNKTKGPRCLEIPPHRSIPQQHRKSAFGSLRESRDSVCVTHRVSWSNELRTNRKPRQVIS